jgi:hypothetical protein
MSAEACDYRCLCKYLKSRFADRIVLTFREIEDLLGFSLPAASLAADWWISGAVPPSLQSGGWTPAGRTANVNLPARSVIFERVAAR